MKTEMPADLSRLVEELIASTVVANRTAYYSESDYLKAQREFEAAKTRLEAAIAEICAENVRLQKKFPAVADLFFAYMTNPQAFNESELRAKITRMIL